MLVLMSALAASVLTGCLRAEMEVEVGGDGSGTAAIEVYIDEAELGAGGISQDDLVELAETATQQFDGVEVSAVEAVGSKGFRVQIPFDDYRQLTQSLTNGDYGGVSIRLFQTFVINEGADGGWSMSATVDPVGVRATLSQIPTSISGSASSVDSSMEFVFSMTLPGKVLRSNATAVDGGTARWNLKGDIEAVRFTMENDPPGITTLQMIFVLIGGLLLIGTALVLISAAGGRRRWDKRRRRRWRKGQDVVPHGQWQPTTPVPGTAGGRDESLLPALPGDSAHPDGGVASPVGHALVGGQTVAPSLPPITTTPPDSIGGVGVSPALPLLVVPVQPESPAAPVDAPAVVPTPPPQAVQTPSASTTPMAIPGPSADPPSSVTTTPVDTPAPPVPPYVPPAPPTFDPSPATPVAWRVHVTDSSLPPPFHGEVPVQPDISGKEETSERDS